MRNLILLLFFLIGFLFLPPKHINAQGVFSCNFVPQTGCNIGPNSCAGGFIPNSSYCANFGNNQSQCENAPAANCVLDPLTANCGGEGEGCCRVGGAIQCDGNLRCQNGVCQACGSEGQQCCQSGALGCNTPFFCNTSNVCMEVVIPTGCRLINSTLGPCTGSNITCTNNPSYCCPNETSCSQLQAGSRGNSPFQPSSPTLCNGTGIPTAIGCIPVGTPQAFAEFFLRWAMGVAGGIALALIGYSGFMVMSSRGDPQKLQAGKELLTTAISGLVLIVFGVFILRVVGVDILKIPGFGT